MKKFKIRANLVQALINDLSGMEKAKFPTLEDAKKAAKLPKKLYAQIEKVLELGREVNQKQQTIIETCKKEHEKRTAGVEDQAELQKINKELDAEYFAMLEEHGFNKMKKDFDEKMKSETEVELNEKEHLLLVGLIRNNFAEFKMCMADLDEVTDALGIS